MPEMTSRSYKLSEYIANSRNITAELLSRIHEDFNMRDILSSIIINIDDNTVAQLPTALILGGGQESNYDVQVWDYPVWRQMEEASLSTDYDRRRFRRSTEIGVLRRKVNEHLQYSFIVRSSTQRNTERVIKYVFVPVCPECRVIFGTRQEITKSLEHDFLTGGLNREGLLRELTVKFGNRPADVRYSLLCFNITNFRVINELHGFNVGDKVLQHMYTAIVYSDLHPISYARFESDNFICLIKREHLDTDTITRLCQQECMIDNLRVSYRCICGIFHIDDPGVTSLTACAHARMATKFIKDQFITPWIVFEPKMQKLAVSDTELLDQIDIGIAQHEFEPYFQPIVDIHTGQIAMAEALVRWRSTQHGMIPPDSFIPVLERNGGLSRIDQLMEQKVFALIKRRVTEGLPIVPIDLNLSWTDFADTRFIEQIQSHVLDATVPTDYLRFEITESSYEEIADSRLDVLMFFQKQGVKLLVDDFGQGYSFGTTKNVDFEYVKLDKSLIDKLGQSRKMDLLVKSVIDIFHQLNSRIIAEGVESQEQLEYLRRAGCDYIQGYYFYRPMDCEAFLHLLDRQHEAQPVVQPAAPSVSAPSAAQPAVAPDPVPDPASAVPSSLGADDALLLHKTLQERKSLHLLLDELNVYTFEWDVATHVDVASDKFCKLYNLPSPVIPDMPEQCPLVLPDDRERFRLFYYRIVNGEKMGSDYFRLFKPDGRSYTWYQKTFYTLFDEQGRPTRAIITMRDCDDKFRYRMLRTRDRMLTQQHEIVTFIYDIPDDRFSLTYLNPKGEVKTARVDQFLGCGESQLHPDYVPVARHLREGIASGRDSGSFDFLFAPAGAELRAHYAMVDGEYGHLYAIIGQAEDIKKTRERLEASERLIRMSQIDGLTQIFNRATGEQRMKQLLARHRPGVFGILDCDNFKHVNDTFGHIVGDALLVAIARLMRDYNPDGINMRLGGDEFAFCLTTSASRSEIVSYIQGFFDRLRQLTVPGMEGYPVSVSVGAVIYHAEDDSQPSPDFDSLYRKADVLLYQSKKSPGCSLTL